MVCGYLQSLASVGNRLHSCSRCCQCHDQGQLRTFRPTGRIHIAALYLLVEYELGMLTNEFLITLHVPARLLRHLIRILN